MHQAIRVFLTAVSGAALIGCAGTGGGMNSAPQHLVTSDDGLSEISLPASWQLRPDIGRNADLRVADGEHDRYLLITTYGQDELDAVTLAQAARRLANALRESLGSETMSDARVLKIGGQSAVEHEIRTKTDGAELVFLSTLVNGAHARYHLIGWAPASDGLDALRSAMNGFRESAQQRAERKRVNLEFKWSTPMTGRTSYRGKSVKRNEWFEIQGEQVSTVKALGKDELLISSRVTGQQVNSSSKDKNKELDTMLQDVLKASMTDFPDYVVNRDGEFLRIENLGAYHKRVQEAMLKGLPKGDAQAREKATQLVKAALTEDALAAAMRDSWNNSVQNWAGSSFAIGQSYSYTVAYQAPALGNRSFPMQITRELTGYVPCQAGAAATSCVRLVQHSRIGGRDYSRAVSEAVSKQVGGATIREMEVVNTVEIVTDPKTLRPYQQHEKKVKRVTVEAEGKTHTVEDVDEFSATNRY